LNAAASYFEIISLVLARWEFLGSLYLGTTAGSDDHDARAYCHDFVEPIQPLYGDLHDVADRGVHQKSDLIAMFRDSSLHGMSLIPCMDPDGEHLVGWWVGVADQIAPQNHLRIDEKGNLNVNCSLMSAEMISSMHAFAAYLDDDRVWLEKDRRAPTARFRRSFWSRQRPAHFGDPENWMKRGYACGVPK
jgi:hypothetical protein